MLDALDLVGGLFEFFGSLADLCASRTAEQSNAVPPSELADAASEQEEKARFLARQDAGDQAFRRRSNGGDLML
ncbi:hypothetical protein [Labrys neptuniae]